MAKQTFTTGQVLTAAQMTSLQQTAMLGGAASAKVASYVLVAADAGDAITMSNAGATTITVNTGLFAAGDIVTIINLGAGVCTITAGTATVSTSGSLALAQNQGGVLRFTSASAAIFFQFATPASGDIEGVTAGTGISGGGTSGTVTITNSMATEITAKGDLIVGTGSGTFDNLAAGSNGEQIVADSSTSTGLRYTAGIGITQPIINGSFDVWQRGTTFTSFPSTSTFTADRFYCYGNSLAAGITVSRQATNDTTNLPFIQYAARVARDSGITSTQQINLLMDVETVNSIPFAGKTLTLSFYARKGANYSPTSSLLNYQWRSGTGTDQRMANGYTGSTQIGTDGSVTLTTTWQRFTVTGTMVATATQMGLQFFSNPTGTAGANDWFEITGIQVDVGSTALPIRRSGGTIQGELAACQRYFTRIGGEVAYNFLANAYFDSSTTGFGMVNYSSMRSTPAATFTTASNYAALNVGTAVTACTAIAADFYNTKSFRLNFTVGSARTAGQGLIMTSNNTTNGYIDISAEL